MSNRALGLKARIWLPLSHKEAAKRVKADIVREFGGCTALSAIGVWGNGAGEVIEEPVEVVEVLIGGNLEGAVREWLRSEAEWYGVEAEQEAVLFEVGGVGELVDTKQLSRGLRRMAEEAGVEWD